MLHWSMNNVSNGTILFFLVCVWSEKYKLYSEDAWYFFTTRSKKYPNGNRPDRGVPGGFWKPTGSPDTKILDENSNTMVERRSLDFYEGKGKGGNRTDWKMHEYYPTTNNVSSSNTKGMRVWISYSLLLNMILCFFFPWWTYYFVAVEWLYFM